MLKELPGLTAQKAGRYILITYSSTAGSVLSECRENALEDEEAITLAKAANMLRRHMFQHSQESLTSSFSEECLTESVPSPLFAFIKMTLLGPNIKSQISFECSRDKVECTLSHLVIFNTVKHLPKQSGNEMHHCKVRETPTLLYIGLKLQNLNHSKKLINDFFSLGLCVSYDRAREFSLDLAVNPLTPGTLPEGLNMKSLSPRESFQKVRSFPGQALNEPGLPGG